MLSPPMLSPPNTSCHPSDDPIAYPFSYRYSNGSLVQSGHRQNGVCVYETNACDIGANACADANGVLRFPKGTTFSCCEMTGKLNQAAQVRDAA